MWRSNRNPKNLIESEVERLTCLFSTSISRLDRDDIAITNLVSKLADQVKEQWQRFHGWLNDLDSRVFQAESELIDIRSDLEDVDHDITNLVSYDKGNKRSIATLAKKVEDYDNSFKFLVDRVDALEDPPLPDNLGENETPGGSPVATINLSEGDLDTLSSMAGINGPCELYVNGVLFGLVDVKETK